MHKITQHPGEGYLNYLKRSRAENQALIDAMPKPPTLHERIQTWYNGLSDDNKRRPFTMQQLRALFCETPQRIGAGLFDLGWTRKRMWRDDRPTARYWLKIK